VKKSTLLVPLLAGVAALALAGCSTSPSQTAAAAGTTDGITVVASTNVYGSIAEAVGGDAVAVTSIIDDPSKDPHEYQADGQNQLAVSKAQVVIENGGGYDDFIDTMLSAASGSTATVLNVTDISGLEQDGFNEHLWYDFPTMQKLVDELVAEFSALDASGAATFEANGEAAKAKLSDLEAGEAAIKAAHAGAGVAITEPVPLYLLEAAGLENRTPEAFSEAVEAGTDVPPLVLQETLALFDSKSVALLVYNEQTGGPQTDAVIAGAEKNGIPTLGVTETLPAGTDYFGWMQANVDAVATALGS